MMHGLPNCIGLLRPRKPEILYKYLVILFRSHLQQYSQSLNILFLLEKLCLIHAFWQSRISYHAPSFPNGLGDSHFSYFSVSYLDFKSYLGRARGSPRPTSSNSVGTLTHTHRTPHGIIAESTKQNQHREEAHGVKSRGHQAQASNNPLPVEPHRLCVIPPKSNGNTMCEVLSIRKASVETHCPRFSPRAGHIGSLCLACIKSPEPLCLFVSAR